MTKPTTAKPITIGELRPYMKVWDRTRYQELFDGAGSSKRPHNYRLYLKLLDAPMEDIAPPSRIAYYIWSIGAVCLDYRAGLVQLKDGRTTRLGKLLAKTNELLPLFENDARRQSVTKVNQIAVVCRHPLDVVTMSYGRGWTSCMKYGTGEQSDSLKHEVEKGSLVVYLIDADDVSIKNPSARIVLRPYTNKDDAEGKPGILSPSGTYGTGTPAFTKTVSQFAEQFNLCAPPGLYDLCNGIYGDENENELRHFAAMSKDEIWELEEDDLLPSARIAETSERILALLEGRSPDVDGALAKNSSTPESVLLRLACSPHELVRSSVADNKRTPEKILTYLARDTSAKVRSYVAANRRTPYDSILDLFNDTADCVLSSLIYRTDKLPEIHYVDLAKSLTDEAVLKILADSHQVKMFRVATILQQHPSEFVRLRLALNLNCHRDASDALLRDISGAVRAATVKSGSSSMEALELIHTDPDPEVRLALAKRVSLDEPVLNALATDTDRRVRQQVASRGQLPVSTQLLLARDNDLVVRAEISLRTYLDASVHEILMDDPSTGIRMNVARQTKSEAVLSVLSMDRRAQVVLAVSKNPNTPLPRLLDMLRPETGVRSLVFQNVINNAGLSSDALAEMVNDLDADLDERILCAQRFGVVTNSSPFSVSDFMGLWRGQQVSRLGRGRGMSPIHFMDIDFSGLEARMMNTFGRMQIHTVDDTAPLGFGRSGLEFMRAQESPVWRGMDWGVECPMPALAQRLQSLGISPGFLQPDPAALTPESFSREISGALGPNSTVTGSSFDATTGLVTLDVSFVPVEPAARINLHMQMNRNGIVAMDTEAYSFQQDTKE